MKLYTEEQVREVLSNMLLTAEQVESILKELSPQESPSSPFKDHRYWSRLKEKGSTQDTPAIEDTIKNIDKKIKELEDRRSNTIIEGLK